MDGWMDLGSWSMYRVLTHCIFLSFLWLLFMDFTIFPLQFSALLAVLTHLIHYMCMTSLLGVKLWILWLFSLSSVLCLTHPLYWHNIKYLNVYLHKRQQNCLVMAKYQTHEGFVFQKFSNEPNLFLLKIFHAIPTGYCNLDIKHFNHLIKHLFFKTHHKFQL